MNNNEKPFYEVLANVANTVVNASNRIQEIGIQIRQAVNNLQPYLQPFFDNIDQIVEGASRLSETAENVLRHTALHGWTLSFRFELEEFLNPDLLEYDQQQLDEYFMGLYEKHFEMVVENIKEGINNTNDPLIDQVIESYKRGDFVIAIPSLILMIEGEIANILESQKYGKKLLNEWKRTEEAKNQEDFKTIQALALIEYLRGQIFINHDFKLERNEVVNRNWILHGKDDSRLWTKKDATQLINLLSTVIELKTT